MKLKKHQKIAIVMGSQSDYSTMKDCVKILKILKISFDLKIVSAHRTPKRLYEFAKKSETNYSVIIAGAGGAARDPRELETQGSGGPPASGGGGGGV